MTLTTNEVNVLWALLASFNGDFGFTDEVLFKEAGLNSKRSLGGVISSLVKKGLVTSWSDFEEAMFNFTPAGKAWVNSQEGFPGTLD